MKGSSFSDSQCIFAFFVTFFTVPFGELSLEGLAFDLVD